MKAEPTVAIIGAMDSEVENLLSDIRTAQTTIAGISFYSGTKNGKNLIIAKSGIGKVNAARCAQILIDRFEPNYIINSGIAGGIDSSLEVGDIVIGAELVQHDFDVTAFGHVKGYLCTGERDDKPTVFASDKRLVELLKKAIEEADTKGKVLVGRIASGDVFVSDSQVKQSIYHDFRASAAEMEGAAIAQTAAYAGVPFVVLRVISDCADGAAAESFEVFEKQTAALSGTIIRNLINLL